MRTSSAFISLCFLIVLPTNSLAAINQTASIKSKAPNLSFVATANPQDMFAGDKQDLVYVIKNTGTAATKLVINGYLPPMVRDNTVPNNCSDALAPGAMCYIKLTTTPTDEMAFKQMLLINNGALTAPLNFAVHALKIVYKDSVATVNAFPYEKQDGKVTLQNSSKRNVLTGINAVVHAPTGMQFKITSTTCGAPLTPGASCVYNYTYQAPPESQVTEEYTRSNVDFDITYTNASASFTLEYPIQVLQFKYGHFVNLPVDVTGYNGIPSNDVFGVVTRGNTIYAATRLGLAISRDAGSSWINYTPTQGFAPSYYGGIKVFVNQNGTGIYVAGIGLNISLDGGKTWKHYDTRQGLSSNDLGGVFASDDGTRIYVAAVNGLNISTDSGKTWELYSDQLVHPRVQTIYASPDGQKIYAGTPIGLSISTDAGKTWQGIYVLNEVSGVYANDDGSKIYAATSQGLYISSDSGQSWNLILPGNGNQSVYVSTDGMRIGTTDVDKVSISEDGGKIWHYFQHGAWPNEYGYDVFVSPDGMKIYAASIFNKDGGLLISTDGGANWTRQKTSFGVADDLVNSVYAKGSNVYAATLNGLSISKDAGRTWKSYGAKEGLMSDRYTTGLYVSPDEQRIYVSSSSLNKGLSISSDGAKTWKNYTRAQGLASNHVSKVYASADGSKIYAAATMDDGRIPGALSISTNSGTSWINYATAQGLPSNDINAVYASDDGLSIYVASGQQYPDGGVSVSHDAGKTWVNYISGLANRCVNDISVNKNGSVLYAATGLGVSRSFDSGLTWKTSIPEGGRIWKVWVNDDGATIYAAGDFGLYVSTDSGSSWKTYARGKDLYGFGCLGVYATPDNTKVYVGLWDGGLAFTYLKKPATK